MSFAPFHKKELYRLMKIKEMELKELQDKYYAPSEYKIMKMIADKFNICDDIEEIINSHLQKIKMKKYIKKFTPQLYLNILTNEYLKGDCFPSALNSYKIQRGEEHFYYTYRIDRQMYYNIYGLKIDGQHTHYHLKWYQDLNKTTKDDIRKYLKQNNIKYLQSDSRHALICRLIGRNPKDPVYTRQIKKRIGR